MYTGPSSRDECAGLVINPKLAHFSKGTHNSGDIGHFTKNTSKESNHITAFSGRPGAQSLFQKSDTMNSELQDETNSINRESKSIMNSKRLDLSADSEDSF